MQNKHPRTFLSLPDTALEKSLLLLGSLLISIWMMRETIALRNILLVTCTLLSFIYLYKNFEILFIKRKISLKNWIPVILIGLLFVWVVIHLFFFSHEPAKQVQELSSTWLRGLMACISGFTIGLIINRNPKSYDWIMFALISGFLILFYQYVGLVRQSGQFFQQMWWVSIYWGKINEVLLGTLFVAGSLAFYEGSYVAKAIPHSNGAFNWKMISRGALYLLGILLVLHCFVFEIDTRNGIGISVILLLIFLLRFFWGVIARGAYGGLRQQWKFTTMLALLIALVTFFAYQQSQKNIGWKTAIEDMQISMEIDKHKNWQITPAAPVLTPSGRVIPINTYERTAWMVVAPQAIYRHPWGYGLLHNAFGKTVKLDIPSSDLTSSHNGWLDFGLSFGIIGLSLLLGSLLWTMALSVGKSGILSFTVFWSSIGLLLCYTLGELMVHHGVEFLLFWLMLQPALLLSSAQQ